MIIRQRLGAFSVDDPFNFRAFSFRAEPGDALEDSSAVEFLDGAAWVAEDALRTLPELRTNAQWQQGLDKMVAFARTRGWVNPLSGRIRAHIEMGSAA